MEIPGPAILECQLGGQAGHGKWLIAQLLREVFNCNDCNASCIENPFCTPTYLWNFMPGGKALKTAFTYSLEALKKSFKNY